MIQKLIHKAYILALDLVFPQKCLGCKTPNSYLCKNCLSALPDSSREFHKKIENIEQEIHISSYRDPVLRRAIRLLKYHNTKSLTKNLGEFLAQKTKPMIDTNLDSLLVVPIPLSKQRLRKRGFNQSELIANYFTASLGLKISNNVLKKEKHTIPQSKIKNRQQRLENIKNSFVVQNAAALKGKTIILVDDVITTGATMSEAGRVLKNAGAKKIIAVAVARG